MEASDRPGQPIQQQHEDRVHFPDIVNQPYQGKVHQSPMRPENTTSVSMDKGHLGDRHSNASSTQRVPPQAATGGAMRSASLSRPLGRNLADTKKARKKIEEEAQLLANRIALLKQEEVKTWKKIQETRKRANQVKTLKRKNEDRVTQKLTSLQMQEEAVFRTQNNIKKLRKQRQDEKMEVQRAILRAKQEEAHHSKIMRHQNQKRKKEQLQQIEEENALRSQIIREQLKHSQLLKQEVHRKKLSNFRNSYENRVNNVEDQIKMREQEVMQMEILEMELIKKLQNTQAVQKSAYMELEDALAQPSPFYINARKHGFSVTGSTMKQGVTKSEAFPPAK